MVTISITWWEKTNAARELPARRRLHPPATSEAKLDSRSQRPIVCHLAVANVETNGFLRVELANVVLRLYAK
jgi:hypothetical protein